MQEKLRIQENPQLKFRQRIGRKKRTTIFFDRKFHAKFGIERIFWLFDISGDS